MSTVRLPDQARSAPKAHPGARRVLILLVAMTAIGPMALNILTPAVPGLVVTFGTDAAAVQLTLSLYLLGLAASQLVMGPLSDQFGRRPVVLAGLTLAAVSSVAALAATSIEALIVARIVQAIGASTGVVVGRAIIRDLYDRDRAAAMIGWVTTATVVAPMLAPMIGGFLDSALGWEAIFAFVGLVSAATLIGAIRVLPETQAAARSGGIVRFLEEARLLIATPQFCGYALCVAANSAMFFVYIGGAPHVVVTMMGRSSAVYGVWFAVASLGYMAGNFIAAQYSARLGVDRMIWWGTLLALFAVSVETVLVIALPHGGPAIIFVPQVIISVGSGFLMPNALAGAVSVRPQAAGTASGFAGFLQMGLGALSAQLVSHLIDGANSALPMVVVMLGFGLAGAVAFVGLVKRG
ncbi:MAG: multidrug effflux MFS transporter [Bradyrhizobiaceae bacterium]|nr:multidrug effflux MFS transporter [Hyphomicrobiales bacterium]MBV9429314.1 multidrug effflux MFS transporter [Bradyrhizobiaceae bacterium]